MTSRREFLQIGVTVGALPLAAVTAGAYSHGIDTLPLYKVVYDKRFDDSVAFAKRMEVLGLATRSIEGDVTRFWYDELYHEWRRGPAAIAGLTAHGPLFCLERLAWDQGMRVVFRAEHKRAGGSCMEHEFTGPIAMLHETLDASDTAWSTRMADVVANCPRGRSQIAGTRSAVVSPVPPSHGSLSLYSWVIAPAARA